MMIRKLKVYVKVLHHFESANHSQSRDFLGLPILRPIESFSLSLDSFILSCYSLSRGNLIHLLQNLVGWRSHQPRPFVEPRCRVWSQTYFSPSTRDPKIDNNNLIISMTGKVCEKIVNATYGRWTVVFASQNTVDPHSNQCVSNGARQFFSSQWTLLARSPIKYLLELKRTKPLGKPVESSN